MRALLVGLAAAAVALGGAWLAFPARESPVRASLSVQETLGGADTAGYARADRVVDFAFPEDHGAHPGFRTEWWYFTGNLETEAGRRFGYQLTLFRSALAPGEDGARSGSDAPAGLTDASGASGARDPSVARGTSGAEGTSGPASAGPSGPSSAWATRQAWMGHFALTDVEGRRFHAAERFERGALGLAGARVSPYRVWVGPWEVASAEGAEPARPDGGPGGVFPLRLRAATDSVAIELRLEAGKGMILQGDRGLSRKGPEPGNASYYLTFPRMPTSGTVRTPEGSLRVGGTSWLDREWSTSALSEGVVGWDWFALQLDDGRELMVYGLRREDGALSELSEGVLVGPSGGATRLDRAEFSIEATGRWESPVDGSAYPSGWRVRVPRAELDLEVAPVLDGQELALAFRYWEGAVDVRGSAGGEPLTGRGYVELTGYAGEALPSR